MNNFFEITTRNIIFDLDGTLIDSAQSIIESLKDAFFTCECEPIVPFNKHLIGPPLLEVLKTLSGTKDKKILEALMNAFKKNYDEKGYAKSKVFDQVSEMLELYYRKGKLLYIATNKRIIPTRRIIKHLRWQYYFSGVFALDSFNPILDNKSVLLAQILKDCSIEAFDATYVGDRNEDADAALSNGLNFVMVDWGYK